MKRATAEKAKLGIEAEATAAKGKIAVSVKVKRLASGVELGKNVGVVPVLFQREATTDCKAGENKDKKLVEYFAVVEAGAPLSITKALDKGVTATFKAPKSVKASNLGVAILVEDGVKMKTLECLTVTVKQGN